MSRPHTDTGVLYRTTEARRYLVLEPDAAGTHRWEGQEQVVVRSRLVEADGTPYQPQTTTSP